EEGRAMIGFPRPSTLIAEPRMKSTCPPKPERNRDPTESETTVNQAHYIVCL
ncbi:unnamed protein product, partial [Onchocerca ochengi]